MLNKREEFINDGEQELYGFPQNTNIEINVVDLSPTSKNKQGENNQPDCYTPPWMTIAIEQAKEIGARDESQVDNIIRKYHKSATGSELEGGKTHWCASFVSWALTESGMENTPRSAGSRFFRDESDESPRFRDSWGRQEEFGEGLRPVKEGEEKLGDIAVWANMDKDGNHKDSGHVAFIFGKDKDGNKLFLGGSQGDTLRVKEYPIEDTKTRAFIGYFRPEEAQNTHSICDLTQYYNVSAANEAAIGKEIEIGGTR